MKGQMRQVLHRSYLARTWWVGVRWTHLNLKSICHLFSELVVYLGVTVLKVSIIERFRRIIIFGPFTKILKIQSEVMTEFLVLMNANALPISPAAAAGTVHDSELNNITAVHALP